MALLNKSKLMEELENKEMKLKLFQSRGDEAVCKRLEKEIANIKYKLEFMESKENKVSEEKPLTIDSTLSNMYQQAITHFSPMLKQMGQKENVSFGGGSMGVLQKYYNQAIEREKLFCKVKNCQPSDIRPLEFQLLADLVGESNNEASEE